MHNSNPLMLMIIVASSLFILGACVAVEENDPRLKNHQKAIEKGKARKQWVNSVDQSNQPANNNAQSTEQTTPQNTIKPSSTPKTNANNQTQPAQPQNVEKNNPKVEFDQQATKQQAPPIINQDKINDAAQRIQQKTKQRLEKARQQVKEKPQPIRKQQKAQPVRQKSDTLKQRAKP